MNIADFNKKSLKSSSLRGTSSQKNVLIEAQKLRETQKKDILRT